MSRTTMIIVSDNQEEINNAKKYWEGHEVTFQVYSPSQWREGLDNAFFRQQLSAGLPTLSNGLTNHSGNVLPFPSPSVGASPNVQKMDDIEAKAIENAIAQYRGNLTEAAKALGIGRATLYRKVKQYQIDPSQARRKRAA